VPGRGWPWLPGSIAGQRDPDEWYVYAEAPELADLRAPCGAAGRNFYYSCCFRTLRGSRPNPGGVWGKFPGLGRDQPGAATAA
jgi:hypothetical protein